jgi:hypothetical protein
MSTTLDRNGNAVPAKPGVYTVKKENFSIRGTQKIRKDKSVLLIKKPNGEIDLITNVARIGSIQALCITGQYDGEILWDSSRKHKKSIIIFCEEGKGIGYVLGKDLEVFNKDGLPKGSKILFSFQKIKKYNKTLVLKDKNGEFCVKTRAEAKKIEESFLKDTLFDYDVIWPKNLKDPKSRKGHITVLSDETGKVIVYEGEQSKELDFKKISRQMDVILRYPLV